MDFKEKVIEKYPHLAENSALVDGLVEKAKFLYCSLRYPFEPSRFMETAFDKLHAQLWVLSACDELVERLGFSSAVAYKENGISWSFDGATISNRLASLVVPVAGVF